MDNYLVSWSEIVDKFVLIEAGSGKDAIDKFNKGEGFCSGEIRESGSWLETEPKAVID